MSALVLNVGMWVIITKKLFLPAIIIRAVSGDNPPPETISP